MLLNATLHSYSFFCVLHGFHWYPVGTRNDLREHRTAVEELVYISQSAMPHLLRTSSEKWTVQKRNPVLYTIYTELSIALLSGSCLP